MKNSSFGITFGGILVGITMVFIFAAQVLPGLSSSMYLLSSIPVGIIIMERDIKSGILVYVASSILGLLILPNKLEVLPYILFFGLIGFENFYSQMQHFFVIRYLIKIVFYLVMGGLGIFVLNNLLISFMDFSDYSNIVIYGGGLIGFLIIDYIYTLAIRYYSSRIRRRRGKDDIKLS